MIFKKKHCWIRKKAFNTSPRDEPCSMDWLKENIDVIGFKTPRIPNFDPYVELISELFENFLQRINGYSKNTQN